jgi:CRP/FNR family transcriptional regulator, cyclic AMP receptor protein
MAFLLTRNSRIEEDLIDQLFNPSERRRARLLLLLANFGKQGDPQPITPNIGQETLAEMIGTTRSRVSAFMNKFRKLGLISYNGHIEVHSRPQSLSVGSLRLLLWPGTAVDGGVRNASKRSLTMA